MPEGTPSLIDPPDWNAEQGALEMLRTGLGWCFVSSIAFSVTVYFLVGMVLLFLMFGGFDGPREERIISQVMMDAWATTAVICIFSLVIGLGFCCAGPGQLPGRALPPIGLAATIFGATYLCQFAAVIASGLNFGGGFDNGPFGILAMVGVGTSSILAALGCLLAYITAISSRYRERGFKNEVLTFFVFLVCLIGGAGLLAMISLIATPMRSASHDANIILLLFGVPYLAIALVAPLWFNKLMLHGWRRVRKDCANREAALKAEQRAARMQAREASAGAPAAQEVPHG